MKQISIKTLCLAAAASALFWGHTSAQNPSPGGGRQNPVPGTTNPSPNSNGNERISDIETNDGRWDCSLPGGNYCVSIGKIISTSIHEFLVQVPSTTASPIPLPTRVVEANITTDGNQIVRFYFVESATDVSATTVTKTALERINQVANEAANRTGTLKPWQMVQKDYPLATHAHTTEFRVSSRADLNRLYGSAKRSWITGKGARFSISGD
jgi:hypothetical protein